MPTAMIRGQSILGLAHFGHVAVKAEDCAFFKKLGNAAARPC